MVQTNAQAQSTSFGDAMRRSIAKHQDQPEEGTSTDSEYTEGQTPADLGTPDPQDEG